MDLESIFISKVIKENCIGDVLDTSFKNDFIIENIALWNDVLDTYKKHGSSPPFDYIQSVYPSFKIHNGEANLSFLIEELRKRWTHNLVSDCIRNQADKLKSREPFAAVEAMRKALFVADLNSVSKDINLAETVEERLLDYDELVKKDGITGLLTPWRTLNIATSGIQKTDLVMFAGRSSMGKTFSQIAMSIYHWSQGYVPLVFSREMSVSQIARRCDAVNAKLPYSKFKSGLLTSEEYDRWYKALKAMENGLPFYITGEDDGHLTVSGIRAKIERYRPSIVYIDGVYMLDDEKKSKAHWEKFSNICHGLHRLTIKLHIPIIVTHQFNLAGTGEKGDGDTLKFGDVKMWFDIMVGLYRDEANIADRTMQMKLLKNREGETREWLTHWDFDTMNFDELSEEECPSLGEMIDF